MMTLTEFLLARLDEDEAAAQSRGRGLAALRHLVDWSDRSRTIAERMLADVQAKRAIVRYRQQYEHPETISDRALFPALGVPLDRALRVLATIYANHPDYNPEWRP